VEGGKDSPRGRRKAERAGRCVLEEKGRQEASMKGTFAGLQNRERGRRREGGGKSEWLVY